VRGKNDILVGVEHLKLHAAELVAVFMALKKGFPQLRSDTLWGAIRKSWQISDLEFAIKQFVKGRIRPFKKLVSVDASEKNRAGKNGFFEMGGYRWGMCSPLSREIGISKPTLIERVNTNRLISQSGCDHFGRVQNFYRFDQVKHACSDLIEIEHRAGRDGFFEDGGFKWGMKEPLSRELRLSKPSVSRRIKKNQLIAKKGKDQSGVKQDFYRLDQVKEVCADLLEIVCIAGKDGFFEEDGYIWGLPVPLANRVGTTHHVVRHIIGQGLEAKVGRDRSGRKQKFYRLDQVQKACADQRPKKK